MRRWWFWNIKGPWDPVVEVFIQINKYNIINQLNLRVPFLYIPHTFKMKFSEILAYSVAFATATAAPTKRTDTVEITFHGAAGAQFTQSFPTDDTATSICMFMLAKSNVLRC